MSGRIRVALLLLLLPALLSTIGYGAIDYSDVSGTVTLDGKPLHAGTITFFDATNSTRSGEIKDGSFTVRKVATGKVHVAVVAAPQPQPAPGGGIPNAPRHGESKRAAPGTGAPSGALPARYGNHETSGLEFDIHPAGRPITVELKSS
jgi:hypothetical protein